MIDIDYFKYIKILLILLFENKVMSKQDICKFLNIDNNHYNNMIETIKQIKKPNLIYQINFDKYEFLILGELNFETGILLGNKFSGDTKKYNLSCKVL